MKQEIREIFASNGWMMLKQTHSHISQLMEKVLLIIKLEKLLWNRMIIGVGMIHVGEGTKKLSSWMLPTELSAAVEIFFRRNQMASTLSLSPLLFCKFLLFSLLRAQIPAKVCCYVFCPWIIIYYHSHRHKEIFSLLCFFSEVYSVAVILIFFYQS